MGIEISTFYRFEGFEIDPANRVLTGTGKPIAIPSRAFDLLLYMVRNPDRLLPKEDLMRAVWGDSIVEESNLTQSVFLLRKALAANQSAENKLIVTVPGRGYRFSSRVEEVPGVEPVEEPSGSQKRTAAKRWLIAGGFAAAIAAAALVVVPGLWRHPGPEIPMPREVTTNSGEATVTTVAISPDGRYLAYASPQSITIQTLKSTETRAIPLEPGVRPLRVSWYPDGTRFIVSERVNGSEANLLLFSILSGTLSPLRADAISPAISADGSHVLYTDGGVRSLWLMDGNGENPWRIMTAPASDKLYAMFFSPDGMRVWFVRVHSDVVRVHSDQDKETITLESCDVNGGRRTIVLSDDRASGFRLLPKGRLVYARYDDSRSFTNLWELPVNPVEGKPEGAPRQLTNWTTFIMSGMTSTADGKHIAFLNGRPQSDAYIGDLRAGGRELANTRRITLDERDDSPAFWTADDKAVVFESNRNGRSQIFRQRLDRTVPELLSMDSEEDQTPRFGGQWIYFRSVPVGQKISWDKPLLLRRIPANGGASTEVLRDVGVDIGCAEGRPDICVLARLRNKTLTFYRFGHATGQGAEIGAMEYDSRLFPGFGLSPDGSEIAAVNPKGIGNRIRRIPLDGGAYSEIEVTGRKGLESVYWAADGKGWFVASLTPANGEDLLHVNLRGESQVLDEQLTDGQDTWGIPSHDGKQLAFLRWTAAQNAWMIDF